MDERFGKSLLKWTGAETPSSVAGFCVLASSSGSKHQDVWMRGLVQVPCQCPKWLSAPSASLLGTRTTGTVWQSPELHYCQWGKIQAPDTESISIQMNVFILTLRTGEPVFWWINLAGAHCAKPRPVKMQTEGRNTRMYKCPFNTRNIFRKTAVTMLVKFIVTVVVYRSYTTLKYHYHHQYRHEKQGMTSLFSGPNVCGSSQNIYFMQFNVSNVQLCESRVE